MQQIVKWYLNYVLNFIYVPTTPRGSLVTPQVFLHIKLEKQNPQ